jgi:hypothetical protein
VNELSRAGRWSFNNEPRVRSTVESCSKDEGIGRQLATLSALLGHCSSLSRASDAAVMVRHFAFPERIPKMNASESKYENPLVGGKTLDDISTVYE